MKHVLTLISIADPNDKLKMVVETTNPELGPIGVEGYRVEKTQVIDPLKLHMFFGVGPCRALDEGVKEAMEEVKKGDGECTIKEFNTEAEKNAYLMGLEDAQGWEGYNSIEGYFLDEDVPDMVEEFMQNL